MISASRKSGIHWLLTGSAWGGDGPLAFAIFGGEEFGEDAGYGRPRLLDPRGVAAVTAVLAPISVADLRARYDPAAEIYPDIWDEGDVFDSYLAPNFERLKALYSHAAAQGSWVLQSIM